ncbi:trans-sialidase, putative [Trypanosoma cruzi marinkellei]|uniref:Trans-sialidase, putative n=1 Tax=Trypanosoma cruzi marinkellei TaxID=85056 RepID=K2NF02_TRYCR|nr:trans-sialidase, putative [Trypanosoma cruzi marinkellei]
MIALAKGWIKFNDPHNKSGWLDSSDIVSRNINASQTWPSIVAEVNKTEWRAHTIFGSWNDKDHLSVLQRPTAATSSNKVFLIVSDYNINYNYDFGGWIKKDLDIQLVEGEVVQATDSGQSKPINWGEPTSLLKKNITRKESDLREFSAAGGSGILMEDGTLVFPLTAKDEDNFFYSTITYSTDNGTSWVFPEGVSSANCFYPRITEWEKGQILMVAHCERGREVFESRDMGATWKKAVGMLPGVWADSLSGIPLDESLRVGALITATIDEKKVMLYTHKVIYSPQASEPDALYLWVTDNNRTFHVGPLSVDSAVNKSFDNTLLYSDDALYLLQEKGNYTNRSLFLARLTEELNTIKSVLTWKELDASITNLPIPTAGLVGFLSNASSGDVTWIDDYRCVNAKVTKATKVDKGFKFAGTGSGATWPMNSWENKNRYGFVNHEFTLVATVTIHEVPKKSSSLLGASLGDFGATHFIGLSYGTESKWETEFYGKITAKISKWEPEKKYQVAIMLQEGKKGLVYVNGVLLGSPETIPTLEVRRREITEFYIGEPREVAA